MSDETPVNPDAAPEEPSGKAKGGRRRAESLSPERRKEISQKAIEARRARALERQSLEKLPRATHTGVLKLIDREIPCAVLEDGTRVLTQSDFMEAMGMYYSGWIAKNALQDADTVPAEVPHFLAQKSLIPFINKHLGHLQNIVLRYKTEKGAPAHGIRAEIIPSICDIYIDAGKEKKLGVRQALIAEKAMLLMRALAHVGIVALVDEATGYQKDRARDALAKILEAYVAKEIQPYVKTFEPDYYEHMFRLRGLPYPPDSSSSKPQYRPQYFGKLTNDIVYRRLAPGVLEALKEEAKKDVKRTHLHRHLTAGYGRLELIKHLTIVRFLMRRSKDWQEFMEELNREAPRYGDTIPIDLDSADS